LFCKEITELRWAIRDRSQQGQPQDSVTSSVQNLHGVNKVLIQQPWWAVKPQ